MRPINARIRSLAVTPEAGAPSNRTSMVLGRMTTRHWVASTCSTSLVPMPKASAPNAPCVDVCESPHTITIPGCVRPSSGPMTCTMPWRGDARSNSSIPNSRAFAASAPTCRAARASVIGRARSPVGTLWSAVATVSSGRRTRRPAHPLDQVVVLLTAHALEVGAALAALLDPFPREDAALDVRQDLLHSGADGGRDERRPARVIAVLRRVRDRVAHELHAAAVHQVHDQLE